MEKGNHEDLTMLVTIILNDSASAKAAERIAHEWLNRQPGHTASIYGPSVVEETLDGRKKIKVPEGALQDIEKEVAVERAPL